MPVTQAVTYQPATLQIEVWDNVGGSDLVPADGYSDDLTPTIKVKYQPKGKFNVFYEDANGKIQHVGLFTANAKGEWEWTSPQPFPQGKITFHVSAADWNKVNAEITVNLIDNSPIDLTIDRMQKDTGPNADNNDFITRDGSANREVSGTLSRPLNTGETLKFWNGTDWVSATVSGKTWKAQDKTSHSSSWTYKVQVINGVGTAIADKNISVVLDKSTTKPVITAIMDDLAPGIGDALSKGKTNDQTPTFKGTAEPNALVFVEYGKADNTHSDEIGSVYADASGQWEVKTTKPIPYGIWEIYAASFDLAGNWAGSMYTTLNINKNASFSVSTFEAEWQNDNLTGVDLDINTPVALTTLNVSGSGQSLNLAELHKSITSLNTVDLTGNGNNSLTISSGDVLALGEESLFIDDGLKQIQVKGNEGDKAIIARQIENFDPNEWVAETGTITSAGIEYAVWHNQHSDVEILVQMGLKTELL